MTKSLPIEKLDPNRDFHNRKFGMKINEICDRLNSPMEKEECKHYHRYFMGKGDCLDCGKPLSKLPPTPPADKPHCWHHNKFTDGCIVCETLPNSADKAKCLIKSCHQKNCLPHCSCDCHTPPEDKSSSSCCKFTYHTGGDYGETNYYVCDKCGKACDLVTASPADKEIIEKIRPEFPSLVKAIEELDEADKAKCECACHIKGSIVNLHYCCGDECTPYLPQPDMEEMKKELTEVLQTSWNNPYNHDSGFELCLTLSSAILDFLLANYSIIKLKKE